MNSQLTSQLKEWTGEFGREYTERNFFTPEEVDALWARNYGFTRSELNRRFLEGIPKEARVLEVGCNIGNQLLLLQRLGFKNLYGIEVQSDALERARSRTESITLSQGTAFDLPYDSGYFDLVFTSGVLIHISPDELPTALHEIHRCSNSYVWGAEYYAAIPTDVAYRGKQKLLWKMDYAHEYLTRFNDLEMVSEQRLPYIEGDNVDSMFLLRKRQ